MNNRKMIYLDDAIDAVYERIRQIGYEHNASVLSIRQAILDLPTAQPEHRKGKWIPHIEKRREYIGAILVNVMYYYWLCDTCGYRVENGKPTYNFCPHCGAKMEVE